MPTSNTMVFPSHPRLKLFLQMISKFLNIAAEKFHGFSTFGFPSYKLTYPGSQSILNPIRRLRLSSFFSSKVMAFFIAVCVVFFSFWLKSLMIFSPIFSYVTELIRSNFFFILSDPLFVCFLLALFTITTSVFFVLSDSLKLINRNGISAF